jgi:V/A-type H+-transporting ATPase subunit I
MAVVPLTRVSLVCPRSELGVMLARLCETGMFHPSDRQGLVQDTQLVILSSRAHAVYSEAGMLVKRWAAAEGAPAWTFSAHSVGELVDDLQRRTSELGRRLEGTPEAGRAGILSELASVRDASLAVFRDLNRIRVFPGSRRFLVIEGYVPTPRLREFTSSLGRYLLSAEPVSRNQPGVPYVPSLLLNPEAVRIFEGVTLSLGVPKYNEVDPTPVVAFVFPLFFGIMFSDLGRGLVLLLGGLYLRNNKNESYRYLGRLLLVLGAAAAVVGALRGEFFGVPLPYPAPLAFPSLISQGPTLQTATFWFELGIVFGTFHLATGYVLAIANRLLSKDYAEALLGYVPTFVLYATTIPFVFALVATGVDLQDVFVSSQPTPFFSTLLGAQVPASAVADLTFPFMVASLLVLLFGRAAYALYSTRRAKPALSSLRTGAVEAIVRPAELLIHTVSYVRLGILLVVGSVLGELMAGLLGLGALGVALAIPGNLAVIAIEAFIVYIQDLRLNVYEWFSKFYSGLGRAFVPLVSRGATFEVNWVFPPP